MNAKCRIYVKAGENEFEAEGNQEFVTNALSFLKNGLFSTPSVMQISASEEDIVVDSFDNINDKTVSSIGAATNPISTETSQAPTIVNFIKEKEPNSHADRVITIAAYLYTYKNCPDFSKIDIENCYRDALLTKSRNINQEINVNRKKGFLDVTGELKDGYKTFHITRQGLEYVSSLDRKPKNEETLSTSTSRNRKTSKSTPASRRQKENQSHLVDIVNLIKSCEEAEAIEKQILDTNSEVNRALLPLYINHKYLDDKVALKTTQIAKVTKDLGIPITRQNALRALKYKGAKFVMSDDVRKPGQPTYYKLNRRGIQYMQSIIQGLSN